MPKPKYKISSYHLASLKWYLEVKTGFNIWAKADCRKVSDLIQVELGLSISDSTLYRLFLWDNNSHKPYYHTLTILAKYLGYDSWMELEKVISELQEFQFSYGQSLEANNFRSLLQFNIHKNTLNPLYDYLEQFPKDLAINKRFVLGQELFLSLKTNPNKNIDFFKGFSCLPIVRSSFYEFLADPDFSIPQYELGLNYYLSSISPHNSWENMQDYIFANSLLLRYHYVKGDKENVQRLGKLIYEEIQLDQHQLDAFYIFPKIRFLAYRMFYDKVYNQFDLEYFKQLEAFFLDQIPKSTVEEQRIIIHTLLDALQVNPILQLNTMNKFKIQFEDFFKRLPNYFNKLSLDKQIYFLNPNASATFPNTIP
jgi:hypothetical protein